MDEHLINNYINDITSYNDFKLHELKIEDITNPIKCEIIHIKNSFDKLNIPKITTRNCYNYLHNCSVCYNFKFIFVSPISLEDKLKNIKIEWNGIIGKETIINSIETRSITDRVMSIPQKIYKYEIYIKNMFYPLIFNRKYMGGSANPDFGKCGSITNLPCIYPYTFFENIDIFLVYNTIKINEQIYPDYYNGYQMISRDKCLRKKYCYDIQILRKSVMYFILLDFYYKNNRTDINKDMRIIIYNFNVELELYNYEVFPGLYFVKE